MNYYRLARVMKIYFTKNLRKQLESMTRQSIRRHKLKVWAVTAFVYCLSFSTCLCRVKGYICLTREYDERPDHPNKHAIDYCKRWLLAGFFQVIVDRSVIQCVQYYSLFIIFIVSRQNKQFVQ